MTKQASNDVSRVKNDGLRLFDELPVICTKPLVVAVPPLPPDILEGGVPSAPAEVLVVAPLPPVDDAPPSFAGVWLLIATGGAVFVFAGTWLVTATLTVGVGCVSVATTTLCVTGTGTTVAVLVLGWTSGCAD